MSLARRIIGSLGAGWVAGAALLAPMAAGPPSPGPRGSIEVDYGALVDRRQPTHSGESVGETLRRLEGRPVPPASGPLTADRVAHGNLDPFLEPYAFVLSDALDALGPVHDPPLSEVGWLWSPGQAQPGWAELLRARRYLIESDGRGYLRAFVPAASQAARVPDDARAAWRAAWPVLRHVLAAERRRLAGSGDRPAPALAVDVHVYRHAPERTRFTLAADALRLEVDDTRPDGLRPPLDLAGLAAFLASGLRLEGARLDADGTLRLLGSQAEAAQTLLGRPLALSDFAVAYRAVFQGGLAEPYMSLDRGFGPQASLVNYGGRLRDTSLGWVSLLCDIRFKTFSLGLDVVTGEDLRDKVRSLLPAFRTHLERLAADPGGQGTASQQTRLWFYPDHVDLTISPQSDVLVLRGVRMSAASERVADGVRSAERSEDPPWTRDTVVAVNRDYDVLARLFPELADLDQVVRLLALFTWLKQAEADGLLVPALDDLLALELPASYTPRTYPQLLAFNAVPPAGATGPVVTLDRVPVAEALERLNPADPPLPARERFARALAGLDPQQPEQSALLAELRGMAPENQDESQLDLLAYRAQRLAMHHRVLTTLAREQRQELAGRFDRGERLRVFSVAIGGLDLGMGKVLERARSHGGETTVPPTAAARTPQEAWRAEPVGLPALILAEHGLGPSGDKPVARREGGPQVVALEPAPDGGRTVWTILGVNGPEVRSRRIDVDREGRATAFERVENLRLLRYRLERDGGGWVARSAQAPTAPAPAAADPIGTLPAGLVTLEVVPPADGAGRTSGVTLRLSMAGAAAGRRSVEAEFPRAVLQRLVSGPQADVTPGQPLPGLSPLPDSLATTETVLVVPQRRSFVEPWIQARQPTPGEEDPLALARALRDWWGVPGQGGPAAAVGVDLSRSPGQWAAAPPLDAQGLLLLPVGGFEGVWSGFDARLREVWGGKTAGQLGSGFAGSLVILVSAEPPGPFAERLRRLAREDGLRGKYLAALCLSGPLRTDLAGEILAEGRLAGLGLGEPSTVVERGLAKSLGALARALGTGATRPERLPGPFLWFY